GGLEIYRGDNKQNAGIALKNLGAGSIEEFPGLAYNGSESLKIATYGMYQGGGIVFQKPVDLGPYVANKNAYLQLALQTPSENANAPGRTGFPGPPGGFPGGIPGQSGQSGAAGAYGAYGQMMMMRGGRNAANLTLQKAHPLQNLRMLLIAGDGRPTEFLLP